MQEAELSGSSGLLLISFALSLEKWEDVKGPKLWCDQTFHLKIEVGVSSMNVGSSRLPQCQDDGWGTREYRPENAETRLS